MTWEKKGDEPAFCMGKQYELFFSNETLETKRPLGRGPPMRSMRAFRRRSTAVRARPATKDDGVEHPSSPARANGGVSAFAAAIEEETTMRVE